MSNTTTVTPYDTQPTTEGSVLEGVVTVAAAGISGIATVINWLAEQTPEAKAIMTAAMEQDRQIEVKAALRLTSVGLNLWDPGSLVTSAKALSYHLAPSPIRDVMLLQDTNGQKLAVEA